MKKPFSILAIMAVLLLAALAASPVYGAAAGQEGPPASHIIVFNDGVDARNAAGSLANAHGLTVRNVYTHALSGMAAIVPAGRLNALANDPRVAFVEANQVVQAFPQELPTGINRANADENSTAKIDGVDDRVDVDIAIIDTGIDLDHPDLNVFQWTNCARKGPMNTSCKDGDSGANDGHGHGTHVAGTAAALDNGSGVVGMAPGARLWAVKVLGNDGSGWMNWIVAGIDYVAANEGSIEVANMSLGCKCSSAALDTAIANTVAKGVTFAVAAGNSSSDASAFSPANHLDVITVSAIVDTDGQPGGQGPSTAYGADDTFASFSNYGSLIELAAPGVSILSTYNDGGTATMSGTSMASPHVAGGAALVKVENPSFTPAQVLTALLASGTADGYTGDPDGTVEPLLNVSSGPPAPVANAGPDQTVSDDDANGAETVTLDGSGSSDSDGSIVSYEWKEGTTVLGTTATITASFDVAGSPHTVTLTVIDNAGLTGSDDVVITVNSNQSPAADAGPDQTVADSGGDGVETVTLDGSGSSDSDGTVVSYEWKEGTTVLGTTATITASFDVVGSPHTVTLTVTDNGGATASDSVVITVNEADTTSPVISNVAPSDVTDTSADVTWDTNEASDSVVNYGTTTALGSTASVADLVTSHLVGLSGLTSETTYYYEVQSTDSSGNTATDDNKGSYYTFTTVAAPTTATTVRVESISYATSGGKYGDKNLLITIGVADDLANPVESASVSITLTKKDTDGTWYGTGSTGADGTVTFKLRNAPAGCYSTVVTNISADGLTWDGDPGSDDGPFCKESNSNNKGNSRALQVE